MPYNVAESFHTKKLCSKLSSRKVYFRRKTATLRFAFHLGGLGAAYAVHRKRIGKPIVDF